jgi:hypothetical protein
MIITNEKTWEEIKATLNDFKVKKVVIAACGVCAAKVGTGGEEGAKRMKAKLESEGIKVITTAIIDEPCDERVTKQALKKIEAEIKEADAILSLACGIGTQAISGITLEKYNAKPALTALETVFMGGTERIGKFAERCRACGECLLNETGGVCPITTCAKSLVNGPCGGSVEGKCEVLNYCMPCGWIMIYDALKKENRLDLYVKIRAPRNWDESGKQRELCVPREGIIPGVKLSTAVPQPVKPAEVKPAEGKPAKEGEKK